MNFTVQEKFSITGRNMCMLAGSMNEDQYVLRVGDYLFDEAGHPIEVLVIEFIRSKTLDPSTFAIGVNPNICNLSWFKAGTVLTSSPPPPITGIDPFSGA